MTSTTKPQNKVPAWVQRMKPGLLREYLTIVFEGPSREAREELRIL